MTTHTTTITARSAIVTGASSGIGAATARRLAEEGYEVTLVARRGDRLQALVAELAEHSGRVSAYEADLSTPDAASRIVDDVIQRTGRIDVLVNAAGVMLIGDSVDQPAEEWERMIDVNLRGLMHLTKAALPHLLATARRESTITDVVNISSVAGRVVSPSTALYTATKFAVTAATEAWRQEYAGRGIRFAAVEPGFVATELGSFQEATQSFYDSMSEQHEILRADDVASVISYIVNSPARVGINELVIRPSHQQ